MLEGSIGGVAEFSGYLHRARAQEMVECGLVRPMGGMEQGVLASANIVPKVHGVF